MKPPLKTSLIVAMSSALTAALILSSAGLYSLLQDRRTTPETTSPASPVDPLANATPVASPVPSASASPVIIWTQAENDYLYDLSQALQPQERDRTTPAEKLAIARQVQGWLDGGADYWSVREKFDATYKGTVLENYAHNRDVYIKFATERLAANHLNTLTPPPQVVEVPVPYPVPAPGQNDGGDQFDGGNPIPSQKAVVTASDFLNCRAKPDGSIVGKFSAGESLEVHRIAYISSKAWYLTTQGCWVSGKWIRLESEPTPPQNQDALVVVPVLECLDKPKTGNPTAQTYVDGETLIWLNKAQISGEAWYLTTENCWVSGSGLQL